MKSIKKAHGILFAFMATLLLWSSCSVEQSTYSIDDISGKAIIKGKAYYNQGQKIENGVYKEDIVAAKNQKIFVDVANSSFTSFSTHDYYYNTNKGFITFVTITDEEGNYEIEIPATSVSYGTDIVIYSEDFTGNQTIITAIQNGNGVYKTIETIYRYSRTEYKVYANESIVKDLKFESSQRDTEENQFIGTTPVKVKIGLGEVKESSHSAYGDAYFSFRAGVEATLTVNYNRNSWYTENFEIEYTGKTNEEGEIEIDVLLQENDEYLQMTLSIPSFRENRFLFPYYSYESGRYEWETYTGTYNQYNGGFVNSVDYGGYYLSTSDKVQLIEARMVFEADPGQSNHYNHENYYYWDYISFSNN